MAAKRDDESGDIIVVVILALLWPALKPLLTQGYPRAAHAQLAHFVLHLKVEGLKRHARGPDSLDGWRCGHDRFVEAEHFPTRADASTKGPCVRV